jgi:hypothetical protein
MEKMGTKNNPGQFDCYTKAEDDEPMFVLLARDPIAPLLIRTWVELIGMDASIEKIVEALDCADAMEFWRKTNRPQDEKP